MKNKTINLKNTIKTFYQDTFNGDVFPVFNVLQSIIKDFHEHVYVPVDLEDDSYYVFEQSGQMSLELSFKPLHLTHLYQYKVDRLQNIMEDVLLSDDIDTITINLEDTRIVLDHELIMYCLKHIPFSNLTFLVTDDDIPVDLKARYNGETYDIIDYEKGDFSKIFEICLVHNLDSVELIDFPYEHMHDLFEAMRAAKKVVNFYVRLKDQTTYAEFNTTWNTIFDDDIIYDNIHLYQGAKLFRQGDYQHAFRQFTLSMKHHNPGAISNIGYCYEEGLGVNQSLSQARKYYALAAKYYESYSLLKLAQYQYGTMFEDQTYRYLKLAYIFAREDKEFYSYPDICYYIALYNEKMSLNERLYYLNESITHYQKAIDDGHDYDEELQSANDLLDHLCKPLIS